MPRPQAMRGPLGAHISSAGGSHRCGERARAIGADAVQLFTKNANQWRERDVTAGEAAAFREAMQTAGVRFTTSHDSYLINLASPDPALRARSLDSFVKELQRSEALGLDAVVSHPGNFIDDRASGLARNAGAIAEALAQAPGNVRLLLETTAGSGTALGATFEELAAIRKRVPARLRRRIGFCADTCHLYAAGYDLVNDFDGVWNRFDTIIGLELLGCLHLNDSKGKLGSRLDRHELIGKGALGTATFRNVMTDPRLRDVPKILETPKGDDMVTNDRKAIALLRRLARASR
jgi:deoxyribonuclease-4